MRRTFKPCLLLIAIIVAAASIVITKRAVSFGSGQGVSGEAVKGWLDDAVTLASAKRRWWSATGRL
ncbi:hypothetical protein C2E31_16955 [Rhodopirellula baltica]|nr:hypothetical protein C2E31_16955 [Rhodopirellula baltica]